MKNVNKYLLILLFLCLLVPLFAVFSQAKTSPEDLIDEYTEIVPDGMDAPSGADDAVGAVGLGALMSEVLSCVMGVRGDAVSFFFLLLGASMLTALSGTYSGELSPLVRSVSSAVLAAAVFSRILPVVSETAASLFAISEFFSLLVPIFTASMALGGAALGAECAGVGMSITLEVCSIFSEKFLLMLVFGMFFASLASSFGSGFGTVASAVKNIFTKGLALLSTLFIGMLTLQTVISASADNMALRAARYAASSIIPIVGGTVSGALSTLVGGAAYAKGIIGGSAVAVIITLAVSPLVTLLAYKLCFFAAISFLEFCSMSEGAACLGGIRDALDGLISVYTLSVVLYILEITVLLISGVSYS